MHAAPEPARCFTGPGFSDDRDARRLDVRRRRWRNRRPQLMSRQPAFIDAPITSSSSVRPVSARTHCRSHSATLPPSVSPWFASPRPPIWSLRSMTAQAPGSFERVLCTSHRQHVHALDHREIDTALGPRTGQPVLPVVRQRTRREADDPDLKPAFGRWDHAFAGDPVLTAAMPTGCCNHSR